MRHTSRTPSVTSRRASELGWEPAARARAGLRSPQRQQGPRAHSLAGAAGSSTRPLLALRASEPLAPPGAALQRPLHVLAQQVTLLHQRRARRRQLRAVGLIGAV